MALRIIRKSSSQSQVELIKGSGEGKPAYSLLIWLSSAEDLAGLTALLGNERIAAEAEVLIYKSQAYSESIQSHLPTLQHTAKLINESKESSWSLRLRSLLQESSSEIGVFLPFLPTSDPEGVIQAAAAALQRDPSLGLAAPTLAIGDRLLAAGQTVDTTLPPHQLAWGDQEQAYEPVESELFYLYHNLPLTCWQAIARAPLQTVAAPLPLAAIRREAYLSLAWADQDWNLPWLAQELAQGLRQKQYRLALLPEAFGLSSDEAKILDAGPMPDSFREKWQTQLRQLVFSLYRHHGWQQTGTHFSLPDKSHKPTYFGTTPPVTSIQDYIAQKG